MKRTAVLIISLIAAFSLLVLPRVNAQVNNPDCDPAPLIAELSQFHSAGDKAKDLDALRQVAIDINQLMVTCYGTPTPIGTPTMTPTLSRTGIAQTRIANTTATMASYFATRTQQSSDVQATRQQYRDNLTATADAYNATATQRAIDRASTLAIYQITLTYIGPVRPIQPTQLPAMQLQPTSAPAIQPTIAPTVAAQPTNAGNGATALCNDGTYSFAATHQGACSRHGGVKQWFK